MPFMTCQPCNATLFVSVDDPVRCPYCLGEVAPIALAQVTARLRERTTEGVSLDPHGPAYRSLRLRDEARAVVEAVRDTREQMRVLMEENAALRARLQQTVAEAHAAVEC